MELQLDDGASLHWRVDGPATGSVDGDWVVFSHSLGCDLHMWDAQSEFLVQRGRRVLRYDIRGHGRSGTGAPPCDMQLLADDLRALLDHLQIAQADLVGISLGGLVVQTLALRAPERMRRLVLADTTARYPDAGRKMWSERAALVRAEGMAAVVESTLQRWFSPGFAAHEPATIERLRRVLLTTAAEGYAGCCAALGAADTSAALHRLDGSRCLVVVGELDLGTPLALSQALQAELPGSQLVVIEGAAHLSSLERADEFNDLLASFLAAAPTPGTALPGA